MVMRISEIIDQALDEINQPRSDGYFTGLNNTVTSIAQSSASDIAQHSFSKIKAQGTITMTTDLVYELPADFRYLVPDTMNAVDNERAVIMPPSDTDWHYLKSQTGQSGITFRCRIFDGSFNFETVEENQVINYEYISNYFIGTSSIAKSNSTNITGTKSRFTSDNDYFLLDENLLIKSIKWRYGQAIGDDGWQYNKQEYESYFKTHKGKESGAKTLDMTGGEDSGKVEPYYPLWQV